MLSSSPVTAAPSPAIFERVVRKRGRECGRCGGRHHDPQFRWCQPCRDITAAYHQAYRLDHKARKLCTECTVKKDKRGIRCDHHLKVDTEFHKAQYADQRAKGLCGYSRCQVATEMAYCDEHRAKQAEYAAKKRDRPRFGGGRRRWAA